MWRVPDVVFGIQQVQAQCSGEADPGQCSGGLCVQMWAQLSELSLEGRLGDYTVCVWDICCYEPVEKLYYSVGTCELIRIFAAQVRTWHQRRTAIRNVLIVPRNSWSRKEIVFCTIILCVLCALYNTTIYMVWLSEAIELLHRIWRHNNGIMTVLKYGGGQSRDRIRIMVRDSYLGLGIRI